MTASVGKSGVPTTIALLNRSRLTYFLSLQLLAISAASVPQFYSVCLPPGFHHVSEARVQKSSRLRTGPRRHGTETCTWFE